MPNAICTKACNQRAMILKLLKSHPSLNTLEFREHGYCSPAPRIFELRNSGIKIASIREIAIDSGGVKHRNIARYYLEKTPEKSLEDHVLGRRKARSAQAKQL